MKNCNIFKFYEIKYHVLGCGDRQRSQWISERRY
jgi:hypothetical protein